jgi:hypothetical protein
MARNCKKELQRGTSLIKYSIAEKINERWRGKRMQGQLPSNFDGRLVGNEQSYRWLKYGDIKGETDCTIVTTQDKAISTK